MCVLGLCCGSMGPAPTPTSHSLTHSLTPLLPSSPAAQRPKIIMKPPSQPHTHPRYDRSRPKRGGDRSILRTLVMDGWMDGWMQGNKPSASQLQPAKVTTDRLGKKAARHRETTQQENTRPSLPHSAPLCRIVHMRLGKQTTDPLELGWLSTSITHTHTDRE